MSNPVPPSGALVATQALREQLDTLKGRSVHVGTRKPAPGVEEFVVVSRIGGGRDSFATSAPRFLVECYHPGEIEAEELALAAEHALRGSVGRTYSGGVITGWDGDDNLVNFPDPNSSHVRFQFSGALGIGTR
ncbi:hypothetical protein [Dietzia alimentaria]|uniref:hypothetical protein n=1 Tax=Dietzia alimentaria TaxID=665550 RepID=UPI00029B1EC4|nr:hypothetical protein [Dietzia alimentaria]